tara:strand:- start:939 stop:1442 length:504 start_codon:yes stop_codon:yes gene_type:complete
MKIAIYGPMCSGKTTVADIIKEINPNYEIFSFGGKIKELAKDLFDMRNKDRTLLITIADKMREIDKDVWAKYVLNQTRDNEYCIIDDLRFQNELNYLDDWKIICLTTSLEERIIRLRKIYPENFNDHLKNMSHISETDKLKLPENTEYIDTNIDIKVLKQKIETIIS